MSPPRACAVSWCVLTHPEPSHDQTFLLHELTVATFDDSGITIDVEVSLGERLGQQPDLGADVLVFRADDETIGGFRLDPADARTLAQILAGLDPAAILQFGRALVAAAGICEQPVDCAAA